LGARVRIKKARTEKIIASFISFKVKCLVKLCKVSFETKSKASKIPNETEMKYGKTFEKENCTY
jgi:hypothetical protein